MLISQSQIGQDLDVSAYFRLKRNGYFVEIGAYDGVQTSNTFMLEQQLNWTGVLVEPLPGPFAVLRSLRKPSTRAFNVAADEVAGRSLTFVTASVLSGDLDRLKGTHAGVRVRDMTPERLAVPTRTAKDMLDEAGAPRFIEFLSVDTEGADLDVLRGVDWGSHIFGFITVEHGNDASHQASIRAFLAQRGYRLLRMNLWDDYFVPAYSGGR